MILATPPLTASIDDIDPTDLIAYSLASASISSHSFRIASRFSSTGKDVDVKEIEDIVAERSHEEKDNLISGRVTSPFDRSKSCRAVGPDVSCLPPGFQ